MNRIIFADIDVPVGDTMKWMPGFIGFMFIVLLFLLIWYYGKKVFGRRPPIDDQMAALEKKLRSEVYHMKGSLRKELVGRIVSLEEKYEQMQLDRERKWAELQKEYHTLELTMARMAGAFDEMKKNLLAKI